MLITRFSSVNVNFAEYISDMKWMVLLKIHRAFGAGLE